MTLKKILKKIKKIEISANNQINSLFTGNYRSVFQGRGIEFADLRPYESGDDVRDIDWKTTAKQNKTYIKKYHESRNNTLFFILDISEDAKFTSRNEKKFENILETFAVLAFSAVKNGDQVGVILSGRDEPVLFPPKKGKHNILKILTTALKFYEHHDYKKYKHNLIKDLKLVKKILKHSSIIFWFSAKIPNLKEKMTLQKALKGLTLKHDFIPIIFTDPAEENLNLYGEWNFENLENQKSESFYFNQALLNKFYELFKEQKQDFINFFRKLRIESVFIKSSDDIFKELFMFFKKRQKHLV